MTRQFQGTTSAKTFQRIDTNNTLKQVKIDIKAHRNNINRRSKRVEKSKVKKMEKNKRMNEEI